MEYLKLIHFTRRAWIVALPALFMGLDIITGLIYAWISKTFDSSKMRSGLGKKFAEMAYIIIGAAVTYAMSVPEYVLIGIAVYILFMEFMSIMENCDKLGAPVPAFVKGAVNNINDSLKNDDYTAVIGKLQDYDLSKLKELLNELDKEE